MSASTCLLFVAAGFIAFAGVEPAVVTIAVGLAMISLAVDTFGAIANHILDSRHEALREELERRRADRP